MAHAQLIAHKDTHYLPREMLGLIPCPEPVGRWRPVPHAALVDRIETFVTDRGWTFSKPEDQRFQISVSKDGQKMFGVTEVGLPGVLDAQTPGLGSEFGLALGFRNSHNKTLAVRLAIGSRVFVCDNMCFSGEVVLGRKHTIHLELDSLLSRAFDSIPEVATHMMDQHSRLMDYPVKYEDGAVLLLKAAELGILPTPKILSAFSDWDKVCEGDIEGAQVHFPGTAWALMNTITAQWKQRTPLSMMDRSSRMQDFLRDINTSLVVEAEYEVLPVEGGQDA